MLAQGLIGKQAFAAGSSPTLRAGRNAELMVSELNGRYYQITADNLTFAASLQSVVALSTLSKTGTGFILTNPLGSGVNLAILNICVALASAPGGIASVHVANGAYSATAVTHGTPLTVVSPFIQTVATVGQGLADSASTLPNTPTVLRAIGGGPVATGSLTAPFIMDDVAGGIVLAPGVNVSLGYITTAISVVASMLWAELPQ